MGGLLIPPWYQADLDLPSTSSFRLVAFLFGFSTACAAFCLATIIHQGYRTWQRSKRTITHPYIFLITMEWTSSLVISIVSYLFLNSVIPPSFWLFFGILCLWVIQIQCLMQIIINRIALIMYDGRRVRRLKWSVAGLIGLINIAVFIIWMPARLQINPRWIAINNVWDRVEKGLLALIDLGLNLKFIHLVHTELIKHGLTKYRDLYRFNISMIFVSISLDIVLIGIMSLPQESSFVYVQFHPLMYMVKLKIEMNMAELIVKIVRATSPPPNHELHRYAASSNPQIARPAQERNDTDTSKGTTTSGTYTTGGADLPSVPLSPTTLVESPNLGTRRASDNTTSTTTNCNHHSNNNNNSSNTHHHNHSTHSHNTTHAPWELKQMPSHFDVQDVVRPQVPETEARKTSVAEGSVLPDAGESSSGSGNGSGSGSGGGLMAPLPLMRPSLGTRNFSELTQLELGAGYVAKEKRDTLVCRGEQGSQV